jgi:hypothetical protein
VNQYVANARRAGEALVSRFRFRTALAAAKAFVVLLLTL